MSRKKKQKRTKPKPRKTSSGNVALKKGSDHDIAPTGFGPGGFWGPSKAIVIFGRPLIESSNNDDDFRSRLKIVHEIWNAFSPVVEEDSAKWLAGARVLYEKLDGMSIPWDAMLQRLRLRYLHCNPDDRATMEAPPALEEVAREIGSDYPSHMDISPQFVISQIDMEALKETTRQEDIDEFGRWLDYRAEAEHNADPSGTADEERLNQIFRGEIHRFILERIEKYFTRLDLNPAVSVCHLDNIRCYLFEFLESHLGICIDESEPEDTEEFLLGFMFRKVIRTPEGEDFMTSSLMFLHLFLAYIGLLDEVKSYVQAILGVYDEYMQMVIVDRGILRENEEGTEGSAGSGRMEQVGSPRSDGGSTAI